MLATGGLAAVLLAGPITAEAALVSACTGVSLPQSVVTDIVGQAVIPVTSLLDGIPLLSLLGLTTSLTTTLTGIAAGDPINLNVLDTAGNVVDPITDSTCVTTADAFTIDPPKGISIGGGYITGLGDPTAPVASAGEFNAIAFGNNATTAPGATNAIAIGSDATIGASGIDSVVLGSGASTDVANSVVLGAGSTATTGARTDYTAYGLTAPQTSVGEVSVGSAGNERTITNVAAGSAATDAVNVSQLEAVDNGAVKYDDPNLKMTVTLGGPISTDGGLTGGTKITNLS